MKRNKIIYWISTGLIAVGMLLSAWMYLSQNVELMTKFKAIGIPLYIVMLLGVAKLLGAFALVVPTSDKLKEWTYAGFGFVFVGALWTHLATGTPWITPVLFMGLLAISYFFRLRTQS